jgi:hypothetical protein
MYCLFFIKSGALIQSVSQRLLLESQGNSHVSQRLPLAGQHSSYIHGHRWEYLDLENKDWRTHLELRAQKRTCFWCAISCGSEHMASRVVWIILCSHWTDRLTWEEAGTVAGIEGRLMLADRVTKVIWIIGPLQCRSSTKLKYTTNGFRRLFFLVSNDVLTTQFKVSRYWSEVNVGGIVLRKENLVLPYETDCSKWVGGNIRICASGSRIFSLPQKRIS